VRGDAGRRNRKCTVPPARSVRDSDPARSACAAPAARGRPRVPGTGTGCSIPVPATPAWTGCSRRIVDCSSTPSSRARAAVVSWYCRPPAHAMRSGCGRRWPAKRARCTTGRRPPTAADRVRM